MSVEACSTATRTFAMIDMQGKNPSLSQFVTFTDKKQKGHRSIGFVSMTLPFSLSRIEHGELPFGAKPEADLGTH